MNNFEQVKCEECKNDYTRIVDKETVYFNSSQLSGELIPVFAQGKGAEKF